MTQMEAAAVGEIRSRERMLHAAAIKIGELVGTVDLLRVESRVKDRMIEKLIAEREELAGAVAKLRSES